MMTEVDDTISILSCVLYAGFDEDVSNPTTECNGKKSSAVNDIGRRGDEIREVAKGTESDGVTTELRSFPKLTDHRVYPNGDQIAVPCDKSCESGVAIDKIKAHINYPLYNGGEATYDKTADPPEF